MALTGSEFETLVKPFFETVFKKIGFFVTSVRNQKSGTQNGFDILIEFNDLGGTKRNICIECKYYKSELRWATIFDKQVQLKGSNYEVDGFILLSPMENLTNIDHNLQNVVSNMFGFPVDFWTPDNGIENIFAIDKALYAKIYNKACALTVNESDEIEKVKTLIENILKEKDNPTGEKPPEKRTYNKPPVYIKRNITEASGDELTRLFAEKKTLIDIIKTNKKIALLGWAGTGKSIELEQLAFELSAPGTFDYPFLIKLNVHTDESIADRIPEINSIPSNLIVLMLDGLDEVQAENIETIRRKVLRFSEDYPEARIIVSCRSNFYTTVAENGNLNTLSGFSSFQLIDLQVEDIDAFLLQNIPLKKGSFLQEVGDKQLKKLLHVPYYLIKLVEQYVKNGAIAKSKAELFENVINENIYNDAAKYYSSSRDIKVLEMRKLLEKLAFVLEYQGKNYCTWEELVQIFPASSELELVKRTASLLNGNEGAGSTWAFSHNNIQEYLVAKVLSKRNFQEIKKIIAFKPNYKKIKPTWVNTLSFLISILDEKKELRIMLINWIADNEPNLMVKFEPDKLDDDLRFQTFEKIFNYYEKEQRRINTAKYSHKELSLFASSERTVKFLIGKIKQNKIETARINAIELIAYFDLETKFPQYANSVKQLLETVLYATDTGFKYLLIQTYITLFKLTRLEFEELRNAFNESKDTWIRHMMFTAIYQQNYQDEYITIVIGHIRKLMETENSNDNRLSNEYYDLKECIVSVKSLEAVKQVLLFIKSDYSRISYSVYFRDIIKEIFEYAAQTYSNDTDIYETIKALFDSKYINGHDPQIKAFIDFFETSGNRTKAFKDIYTTKLANLTFEALTQLSFLANVESINFLADEFKNGQIDNKTVEEFQWKLEWNNRDYLTLFNTLVNEKEKVELPPKIDMEKERRANAEATLILLSDKDKYKAAVEQVFIDGGKEDLTFNEIWDLNKLGSIHSGKYLNTIFDTVSPDHREDTINKTDLLTYIENNWKIFSIRKINHFLKMDKNNTLTAELISYVKSWCDEMISQPAFSFLLGIYDDMSYNGSFNRDFIRLTFFLRRLNFTSYRKDLYLDLLSFPKLDDEMPIIDFVETIVSREEIDKQLLKNLSDNIRVPSVLESHVEYCVRNKLNQATNLFLSYLKNEHTYNRYKILDAYVELNGGVEQLEQVLIEITDDFKFKIVEVLIKQESKSVLQYLLSLFYSVTDKKEKIKLTTYLIQMQNIEGLKYYVKFIKENCHLPHDIMPSNPLYKLTNIKALSLILNLYELGFDKKIRQDRFNDPKQIAATAFQSICLSGDNFPIAERRFWIYKLLFKARALFKKEKLPRKIVQDLNYFFENISQQYYVNKSVNVNLNEAIRTYSMLPN